MAGLVLCWAKKEVEAVASAMSQSPTGDSEKDGLCERESSKECKVSNGRAVCLPLEREQLGSDSYRAN